MSNPKRDGLIVFFIAALFVASVILFPGQMVTYVDPDASLIDVIICYSIAALFLVSYFLEGKSKVFRAVLYVCTHFMWPESKKWALVIFAVFFGLGTDYIVRVLGYPGMV